MPTTMTVKGQVTIPKAVRDRAGMHPGSRVEVGNRDDGGVYIRLVAPGDGAERARREHAMRERIARAQEAFRGLDRFPEMTTDEHIAMVRELLEPFEAAPATLE